jgi:hypothetical protein
MAFLRRNWIKPPQKQFAIVSVCQALKLEQRRAHLLHHDCIVCARVYTFTAGCKAHSTFVCIHAYVTHCGTEHTNKQKTGALTPRDKHARQTPPWRIWPHSSASMWAPQSILTKMQKSWKIHARKVIYAQRKKWYRIFLLNVSSHY